MEKTLHYMTTSTFQQKLQMHKAITGNGGIVSFAVTDEVRELTSDILKTFISFQESFTAQVLSDTC